MIYGCFYFYFNFSVSGSHLGLSTVPSYGKTGFKSLLRRVDGYSSHKISVLFVLNPGVSKGHH